MATHSSVLAWAIPWTEEAGGLQPRGPKSQTLLSLVYLCYLLILSCRPYYSSSLRENEALTIFSLYKHICILFILSILLRIVVYLFC